MWTLYLRPVVSSIFFSSPVLSRHRLDVYHTSYTWCGLSANLGCRSETCCTQLTENTDRKKSPKIHHLHTIAHLCQTISSQLRHLSTTWKNLLNSNISPTCPQNMVNFSPVMPEIGSLVWGTPTNFNGFCIFASLLQRRRSIANQTLHDVWPSPGLAHYIYIFGGSCPIIEFCQVQNSLYVQVLRSSILAALLYGTRVVGVSQTLRRWAVGATYIRQGGHHVGRWPTF